MRILGTLILAVILAAMVGLGMRYATAHLREAISMAASAGNATQGVKGIGVLPKPFYRPETQSGDIGGPTVDATAVVDLTGKRLLFPDGIPLPFAHVGTVGEWLKAGLVFGSRSPGFSVSVSLPDDSGLSTVSLMVNGPKRPKSERDAEKTLAIMEWATGCKAGLPGFSINKPPAGVSGDLLAALKVSLGLDSKPGVQANSETVAQDSDVVPIGATVLGQTVGKERKASAA